MKRNVPILELSQLSVSKLEHSVEKGIVVLHDMGKEASMWAIGRTVWADMRLLLAKSPWNGCGRFALRGVCVFLVFARQLFRAYAIFRQLIFHHLPPQRRPADAKQRGGAGDIPIARFPCL